MARSGRLAPLVLAALVLAAGLGGPAAANGTTPVCPVCTGPYATAWEDASYAAPDSSGLTVDLHGNGSATWSAELEWDDTDTAPDTDDEATVEDLSGAALADSRFLPPVEAVSADVRSDGRATVRWRTPNVAEYRFGEGVVTLFRTTGGQDPPRLNAEALVVRVPDGTVVTNDPSAGSLRADRTELRYAGPGPVDDFYVVYGDEPGGLDTTLAVGSVVWPRTAANLLVILGPAGVALGVGLAALYTVSRRRDDLPGETMGRVYGALGLGLGAVLVGGIVLAGPSGRTSVWATAAVVALLGLVAVGHAAATGDRRRAVGTAVLVYLVLVGPFVAREWPLVDLHPLYRFAAAGGLLALTVAVVLLGTPAYLFGDALARRRSGPVGDTA